VPVAHSFDQLINCNLYIFCMNISGFDLNLLRVLDALLCEGSVTRAAERIGLSQPATSAALGRLRHALGDPLFVRHGQGLVPTDHARSLEIPLRDILDRTSALIAGPDAFDPARATSDFRIGGSDFFAEMLMPKLGAAMSRQAPDMVVQLVDLVPENYVTTLQRYVTDIALIPGDRFPEWTAHRPLFRSSFRMIARSGHPRLQAAGVAPGAAVPIDLFCDLGHVLFSPEGKRKAMGDAALAAVGRARRVVMTVPVFAGVCRAVEESDLVGLLPRQLAEAVAPRLGLAIYSAPMPLAAATISMVWHRRSSRSPAHRWMRNLIATLLTPLNIGEAPLPAAGTMDR
jgi:DNA-binding transcriptional LysR family regulator